MPVEIGSFSHTSARIEFSPKWCIHTFQSYLLVKALPNLLVKTCFWCRIFTLFLTEESAKFPLVLGKLNRTWITCFKYKEGIFFFSFLNQQNRFRSGVAENRNLGQASYSKTIGKCAEQKEKNIKTFF